MIIDFFLAKEDTPTGFKGVVRDSIENFLSNTGLPESWITYINLIIYLIIAIVVVAVLQYSVRAILTFIIKKAHSATKKNILDYAMDNRLPHYLALLAPYTFIRNFIPTMFSKFPMLISPLIKVADIYLVLLVTWSVLAIIKSFINVLKERPAFAHKPMRSYVQVISIVLYGVSGVVMFAIITEQTPGVIFAGLGAVSALTILIFQDSIKGFVGSIQMTTNNMVALGDWIEVRKHDTDGHVIEINLTTVKIRNWDNTVTTVPTYSLISDSFQNWKPMQNSGGRRLKRALLIKQGSIRFLKATEIERYKEMSFLTDLISEREKKYNTLNRKFINNTIPITNNDLFMAYGQHYLDNNPDLNKTMWTTFRQLEPTSQGLPLEIWAFTNETSMIGHNEIASEIINHLIGMVGFFDLKLFEILSDTAENP